MQHDDTTDEFELDNMNESDFFPTNSTYSIDNLPLFSIADLKNIVKVHT